MYRGQGGGGASDEAVDAEANHEAYIGDEEGAGRKEWREEANSFMGDDRRKGGERLLRRRRGCMHRASAVTVHLAI